MTDIMASDVYNRISCYHKQLNNLVNLCAPLAADHFRLLSQDMGGE